MQARSDVVTCNSGAGAVMAVGSAETPARRPTRSTAAAPTTCGEANPKRAGRGRLFAGLLADADMQS